MTERIVKGMLYSDYQKAYYQANFERILQLRKEYYLTHKSECYEYSRRWIEKNKVYIKEYHKKYYYENISKAGKLEVKRLQLIEACKKEKELAEEFNKLLI
jgi:hypothetical protein